MSDITTHTEKHVNPYEEMARTHVPAAGDVYAERNPCFNGCNIVRLTERWERNGIAFWHCADVVSGEKVQDIGEESLKEYYRWIGTDFAEASKLAVMLSEGKATASEVTALVTGGSDGVTADAESLMATESPEHIAALLDASEKMQAKLNDVRLIANCLIEQKKRRLDLMLSDMRGCLDKFGEKVNNLLKVITVLNLYTGASVDIHRISEGESAPAGEPLSLRQRVLFMDEELCVHLDHEADYRDVPAFFEWLKEPVNRDLVVPESRCVVCLKPKRFDMAYRSGDRIYDYQRNLWNKHTYVVIRNGENLFWLESDDLEVWEWAFPHEDFEECVAARLAKDSRWNKESVIREHDSVKYRVTKYMMFLQGLVDQRQDLFGPTSVRPNLMKLQGVFLVRDDENLLGTGRVPWEDFRKTKNALIRHGSRILYVAAPKHYSDYRRRPMTDSGDFLKDFVNQFSQPLFPGTGLYSAEAVDVVVRHVAGKAVTEKYPHLVFKYLPEDTVWDRTECENRERKKRVSWVFSPSHVLNYDAVTLDELNGYLEDRSLRASFAAMIPILVNMRRHKEKELRDEEAFKELLSEDIRRETGSIPSDTAMDEAVSWWKTKVIFTRALRSDDRKAWKMIRSRVLNNPTNNQP